MTKRFISTPQGIINKDEVVLIQTDTGTYVYPAIEVYVKDRKKPLVLGCDSKEEMEKIYTDLSRNINKI